MNHLFVTYSSDAAKNGHIDPNFTQLIYGDIGQEANVIKKNLKPGSFIFFNTNINNQRYITAYFYIEKILTKDKHKDEIDCLNCSAKVDDVIVVGNRLFSKVLTLPLKLDKQLLIDLKSFEVNEEYFSEKASEGYNELQAISHKTYNNKLLSEDDKNILLEKCKNRG